MSKFTQMDNGIPLSIIFALRGVYATINKSRVLLDTKITDHNTFISTVPLSVALIDLNFIICDTLANVSNTVYDVDLLENQYAQLDDWDVPGNVVTVMASLLPILAPESELGSALRIMYEYVKTLLSELRAITDGEYSANEHRVMSHIVKELDGYLLSK